MKNLLVFIVLFFFIQGKSQCPLNFNFSESSLTHWFGYTGIFKNTTTRLPLTQTNYDSISNFPTGTINTTNIPEYNTSLTGIEVLSAKSLDPFGNFETVPTINGYSYNYSIKIGSTTINPQPRTNPPSEIGGYFRGIGYTINVPPGLPTDPYVVTYAYAMVLENGQHTNDIMPLFTAKLTTQNGTIDCANAQYYLPTLQTGLNTNGNPIFELDQGAALQEGFSLSSTLSPNDLNTTNPGSTRKRVWTKGWREVIVDLAPWRGQQVTLTFEADNCVPTGHFAYAYVALKNVCQGLQIEGTVNACANEISTYSIPELSGAKYHWQIPAGWQSVKDSANTITVIPNSSAGTIVATATNTCADLKTSIPVAVAPPTIPGNINGDSIVCKGLIPNQNFPLNLVGYNGSVLNWISSIDNGLSWTAINNNTSTLSANNLSETTIFRAIVQNGAACRIDTSAFAQITLNPKPFAGIISPTDIQICQDQPILNALTLNGSSGNISNWQSSHDLINWTNTTPTNQSSLQSLSGITSQTYFRAIVSTSACPADTSNNVHIEIYNALYPKSTIFSKDTTICFDQVALLNASISIGSGYQWSNSNSNNNLGTGLITANPFLISSAFVASKNTDYILTVSNAGCPNLLRDTIHVKVLPQLSVNAGRDTVILINQPLQINAILSDQRLANYLWTPTTGLSNMAISNPIAILDGSQDQIRYSVTATDSIGCSATNSFLVTILKNGPEIFVPTGFTPNADGKNDVLRPTVYGITQKYFFSVFNRWGQQIFFSTQIGMGWDGTINGIPQPAGAYVFIAEGADYLGKRIISKGTAVLIR